MLKDVLYAIAFIPNFYSWLIGYCRMELVLLFGVIMFCCLTVYGVFKFVQMFNQMVDQRIEREQQDIEECATPLAKELDTVIDGYLALHSMKFQDLEGAIFFLPSLVDSKVWDRFRRYSVKIEHKSQFNFATHDLQRFEEAGTGYVIVRMCCGPWTKRLSMEMDEWIDWKLKGKRSIDMIPCMSLALSCFSEHDFSENSLAIEQAMRMSKYDLQFFCHTYKNFEPPYLVLYQPSKIQKTV